MHGSCHTTVRSISVAAFGSFSSVLDSGLLYSSGNVSCGLRSPLFFCSFPAHSVGVSRCHQYRDWRAQRVATGRTRIAGWRGGKKATSNGWWRERAKLLVLLLGFLAGIPDLHRLVTTTTDNSLAIRTDRHATAKINMFRDPV